jgi:SAM-dependent methyltransferase
MRKLLRAVVHTYANHGLLGTVYRLGHRLISGRPDPDTEPQPGVHPFDLARGVDTGGYIPGKQLASALGGRGAAAEFYNTAYYGIAPSTLRQALSLLPEPVDPFTFIDLGCGKGRGLLVAAELPFQALIGVELSPQLCAVAQKNLAADPRCSIVHQDAASYHYPATALVIYLYHPFLKPLLRRVLRNLDRQMRATARPLYLLYANPGYPEVLGHFKWLRQVWDYSVPLSAEDAAADRHGITHERYTLYRAERPD